MNTEDMIVYVEFVPNRASGNSFVAAHYVARMGDQELTLGRDYGWSLADQRKRVAQCLAEQWLGNVVPVGAVQKIDEYITMHTFRKQEKSNEEG